MHGFLALGDSYTIGEGVAAIDRWPSQLARRLADVGLPEPQLVARTAWTTDELADAITEVDPVGPFSLVSLMIGVNDQYRGRPVGEFASGFAALLDTAIALAASDARRVVAISIPDWGVTPFAAGRDGALIAREIDAFNERARSMATAKGAKWVDVTESSRAMGTDPSLVVADGLHPSGAMYSRWAALIEQAARVALGE